MSNVLTCAGCSTRYAPDLDVCPHCGSSDLLTEGGATVGRLPLFVSLSCVCTRTWQLRLSQRMPGLIELPRLFCASCGRQVQIPWPPVEDDMSPKITKHGGPTNARGEESSPDSTASAPLAGAEADQGHPTPEDVEITGDGSGEALPELDQDGDAQALEVQYASDPAPDYDGMTLTELREVATERGVPAYGTKAQITERLREADAR